MQKGKLFKAQALPFILINEKNDQGKVSYEFQLQRKAVDLFAALKNKRIAVATVAGPQRSGKSFLSNRLLKRMTGFAIGPSTMPCTKGLWIWGEPIDITPDTVLIIMDTEGLNSVQRDINVDLKIFSLSVLLSSVFIYNSLGHIDEKALENMSYVLRITENIRMKSELEAEGDISQCFPFFYWVLRDFSLDLKGMTENEYLQNALRPLSNDEKDPKNQIRSKIRKLFAHRRCECFPRPINEQDKLAHIQQLRYEDLRQKFKDKMQQFQRVFFETLPVKTISGKPLTADLYLNLVREYIDAMNGGRVPQVLTSLERVLQSQARQITEGLMNNYREAMAKVAAADKPVDDILIERNHRDFIKKIEEKIDQKLKNWLDVGRTGEYKARLMQSLDKDYKERLKRNSVLSEKVCVGEFQTFSNVFYNLPQMKGVQLISDSYFKEKYNEYTRKIQSFFDNCRAPRKYTFFIQKFPKATFDFFDLCFARAKGVFNNEMNKVRAQGRNLQAQVQSAGRIMQEQQNLLSEKQKQIEALSYERDLLRRQHQKNEKMKQLEKETQNMGKNQLKKTLEGYKAQLIDLEHENQDLEAQLQKIRTELSTKKIEISQMVKKTSEPLQDSDQSTNLPNELVTVLSSLKDRLTIMKEYYEKTVSDQSFQESMMRQIEEQRTEKHAEIQKIKEKWAGKMAELRQKYARNQNDYEKNIKLINMHVDDLKTQNMDLQRAVCQLKDKKGGNMADRKGLEESLRLKTNSINGLKAVSAEKDKRIEELQFKLASLNSSLANLQSYKETFPFILSESLAWLQGRNNKLKHSIKTLSGEDQDVIRKIFKQQGHSPF